MSWIVMAAAGALAMWSMRFTPPRADFVLVRVAGAAFIAAGLIGVTGWFGVSRVRLCGRTVESVLKESQTDG